MSDAEVYEHFFDHNPLNFDQEALNRLKAEHGVVPTWANKRWREEQTGYRGLRPVSTEKVMFGEGDDQREEFTEETRAVLACCTQMSEYDIEVSSRDGVIRHGDLVLCVQPVALKERNDARRKWRAERKLRSLKKGQSELADQIRKDSGGKFAPTEAEFESERAPLSKVITSKRVSGGSRRK